jgi:hypothetical protein
MQVGGLYRPDRVIVVLCGCCTFVLQGFDRGSNRHMMAAMTLTLAHGHVAAAISYTTPPPPPYNPILYATAATIIPVLFLAIGVQGDTYKDITRWALNISPIVPGTIRGNAVVLLVVAAVPGAGIGGEITAILVLAWGHADFRTYRAMLLILTFLVVVAALGPLVQFGLFAREMLRYAPGILADSPADSPAADSPGDVGVAGEDTQAGPGTKS